jgi:hypothetical protein
MRDFLYHIITNQVDTKTKDWIDQKIRQLTQQFSVSTFYTIFASVPRFVGKESLILTKEYLLTAAQLRKGFTPENWTVDRASRVLFLLYLPTEVASNHLKILNTLFQTAEVNELVALYSALPLLPFPDQYVEHCAEGIRTNMSVVFEAVALNNPFPAEYLSENAWNQLFLKAIFTGRKVIKIQGIAERANANLAQICSDYAHERWAAGRKISPELWIPVGKFVNEVILSDLKRLAESKEPLEQEAFALVCFVSDNAQAKALLESYPSLKQEVEKGSFSWESIANQWHELNF